MNPTNTDKSSCSDMVRTLEAVLTKFNEIDTQIALFHDELRSLSQEMTESKSMVSQTMQSLQQLGSEQENNEKMRSMVSTAFENLFSQMSQIVNSAREDLLERSNAKTVETTEADEKTGCEPVTKTIPNVTLPKLPVPDQVAETLQEVAKTLIEEEAETMEPVISEAEGIESFAQEIQDIPVTETELEEPKSRLSDISALLAGATREVSKELLGENPEELDTEIPMSNEPPTLLKETLLKSEAISEMETEDLGAEEIDEADEEEVSELLKNISSSYVAGTPE